MPFETYLLSLKADDALALVVLAVTLGWTSFLAITTAILGWVVSPRMEG